MYCNEKIDEYIIKLTQNNVKQVDILNHQSMYPDKLFRYRPINKQEINAIRGEYVFVKTADKYKDPTDGGLKFYFSDDTKISRLMTRYIVEEGCAKINYELNRLGKRPIKEATLQSILRNDTIMFPEPSNSGFNSLSTHLLSVGLSTTKTKKIISIIKKSLTPEAKDQYIENAKNSILNMGESAKLHYNSACFTTDNDNIVMWEIYADNYKGMCVEFSLPKRDTSCQQLGYLFPIIYGEKEPFDMLMAINMSFEQSRGLLCKDMYNTAEMFFQRQMRTKNILHSYEKEWRLMIPVKSDLTRKYDQFIPFPFISAIYVGKDIPDGCLASIMEVSLDMKIPVYKQSYCRLTQEFKYIDL